MKNPVRWKVLLMVFATSLAGCDSGHTPVSPSVTPEAPAGLPPPVTSTVLCPPASAGRCLAGTVSDAAFRRLPGARVEVTNGVSAGLSTLTSASGEFQIAGAFDETTVFRASIDGHTVVSKPFPPTCPQCNPNWWLHFTLESLAPHADLAGDWTLTFVADATCGATFPVQERTRTYAATITASPQSNSEFLMSVHPPAFVAPWFGRFGIGVAGDDVSFWIGDSGHDGVGLFEETTPGTFFTISGELRASVTEARPSIIAGAFQGVFERCQLGAPWGSRYNCSEPGATARVRCESRTHQLVLQRR